jgi:hypothetical protein
MELLADEPESGDVPFVTAAVARLRGSEPLVAHVRMLAVGHLLSFYRRGDVPPHLRDVMVQALDSDQGANEGDAAMFAYFLDRDEGLRRMRDGLRSEVPLARAECAAALVIVRSDHSSEVLRHAATPEATAMLAFLRGHDPERAFEPVGTLTEVDGTWRRVFSFDELMAAYHERLAFAIASSFVEKFEPLVRRWDAH